LSDIAQSAGSDTVCLIGRMTLCQALIPQCLKMLRKFKRAVMGVAPGNAVTQKSVTKVEKLSFHGYSGGLFSKAQGLQASAKRRVASATDSRRASHLIVSSTF
jgi:hypothetical protein